VFFVALRFVSAAIILTVAGAFAFAALACLGLAHMSANTGGADIGPWVIAAIVVAILVIEARRRRAPLT
jgi:hypothetical protein